MECNCVIIFLGFDFPCATSAGHGGIKAEIVAPSILSLSFFGRPKLLFFASFNGHSTLQRLTTNGVL